MQYGEKPHLDRGKYLFGSGFTKYLKGEVETDSSLAEVVSLPKCYHPYNSNSHQSTIGRTKTQFFCGGPDRRGAVTSPHQAISHPSRVINHTSKEAARLTNPGEGVDLSQCRKGDFRHTTSATGTISYLRYSTSGKACMHTSWWQTIPICTQLGLSNKRPMGLVNSSRLPSTFESVAPIQGGSMHAAADRVVTSSQDRDNKIGGKRSCSTGTQEPSAVSQLPFL